MKVSVAVASLLAASASAFDKYQPWGKRDYSCVNIYQGIPDNSTVAPGDKIDLRFNRAPTTHCADPLNKYEAGSYSVWLYNNPVRHLDTIHFDQELQLKTGIRESDGAVTITIPKNVTAAKDDSVWYLRLDTTLTNAPQMPSLYDALGPFSIKA
ncbi:hypothetical protein N8T08_004304 [Aspergillus melleus]|uniref:Uncharacterized protein n=1 Tax=Aspergillus melleus TaxID=138277 RepID=A0ACC3B5D5_9EURO|nr:hypothetical protein N8T08_004304 [Aspergillus melleus]